MAAPYTRCNDGQHSATRFRPPDVVSDAEMGTIFGELIRKFAELSNETAGEHCTPREVIRLMVNLLFVEDDAILSQPGVVRMV